MSSPGIMIAAPKSGSGKTMITCALLELLKERGMDVTAYKCGPDYIDPMFHREVIGVPSRNLDGFFADDVQLGEIYASGKREGSFAVVEGVMGLYDGLGGTEEAASSYHLAQVLEMPILLVVDAKGMGRSILPLIAGFLAYDRAHLIGGILLNRVSRAYCDRIAPLIRQELKVPVIGCFPEQKEVAVESRHLGLVLPVEIDALKDKVQKAAGILAQNMEWDQLWAIAGRALGAADTAGHGSLQKYVCEQTVKGGERQGGENVRIAVARDEAFCFYYEENLEILRQAGAEIVAFSPLHDQRLPEGVSGILLGGGYPELYAEQLAANTGMKASVKNAIKAGMPSVAECGGFMYLHETLVDQNGQRFAMCGVLPGKCEFKGRLIRFGYVSLEMDPTVGTAGASTFLEPGETIRGHEFHYYDSTDNGSACHAVKPVSGQAWDCVHAGADHWWGFPHLSYLSNPLFAQKYIHAVIAYKNCQLKKNVR